MSLLSQPTYNYIEIDPEYMKMANERDSREFMVPPPVSGAKDDDFTEEELDFIHGKLHKRHKDEFEEIQRVQVIDYSDDMSDTDSEADVDSDAEMKEEKQEIKEEEQEIKEEEQEIKEEEQEIKEEKQEIEAPVVGRNPMVSYKPSGWWNTIKTFFGYGDAEDKQNNNKKVEESCPEKVNRWRNASEIIPAYSYCVYRWLSNKTFRVDNEGKPYKCPWYFEIFNAARVVITICCMMMYRHHLQHHPSMPFFGHMVHFSACFIYFWPMDIVYILVKLVFPLLYLGVVSPLYCISLGVLYAVMAVCAAILESAYTLVYTFAIELWDGLNKIPKSYDNWKYKGELWKNIKVNVIDFIRVFPLTNILYIAILSLYSAVEIGYGLFENAYKWTVSKCNWIKNKCKWITDKCKYAVNKVKSAYNYVKDTISSFFRWLYSCGMAITAFFDYYGILIGTITIVSTIFFLSVYISFKTGQHMTIH